LSRKKPKASAKTSEPEAKTSAAPPPRSGPVLGERETWLAMGLAWLLPGAGHLYLGRKARALAFCALVFATLILGVLLDGELVWQLRGSPLRALATLGTLGGGLPVLVLRFALHYAGDVTAAGFEYGKSFILTAGLMNVLLVLDAFDIAKGRKS